MLARIIAQWLTEKMGQTFIVEKKAGGGNNIGAEFALRQPADGYMLFLVNPANGIDGTHYKDLPFSIIADMAPVAGLITSPVVQGREGLRSHAQLTARTRYAYLVREPGTFRWRACGRASPRSNRSCSSAARPCRRGNRS